MSFKLENTTTCMGCKHYGKKQALYVNQHKANKIGVLPEFVISLGKAKHCSKCSTKKYSGFEGNSDYVYIDPIFNSKEFITLFCGLTKEEEVSFLLIQHTKYKDKFYIGGQESKNEDGELIFRPIRSEYIAEILSDPKKNEKNSVYWFPYDFTDYDLEICSNQHNSLYAVLRNTIRDKYYSEVTKGIISVPLK